MHSFYFILFSKAIKIKFIFFLKERLKDERLLLKQTINVTMSLIMFSQRFFRISFFKINRSNNQ